MDLKPRTSPAGMADLEAHARAMSLPIGRIVSALVDALGATAVSQIGGVIETRAVTQWTGSRTPQRANVLRFAYQLLQIVAVDGDRDVARAWFSGSNPHLEDRVPLLILRDKPLSEIAAGMMSAARAFAAR